MKSNSKNLHVFGYGLSLLIPFFVFWKSKHMPMNFGTIILLLTLFGLILFITSKTANLSTKFNLWIVVPQILVYGFVILNGFSLVKLLFLIASSIVLFITLKNAEKLDPIYKIWMKGAHFIGTCVFSIIFAAMFYIVFGLIGIILRIFKIDLLDEKLDKNKKSYWIKRNTAISKKSCLQQF